jgi:hypothetical protein
MRALVIAASVAFLLDCGPGHAQSTGVGTIPGAALGSPPALSSQIIVGPGTQVSQPQTLHSNAGPISSPNPCAGLAASPLAQAAALPGAATPFLGPTFTLGTPATTSLAGALSTSPIGVLGSSSGAAVNCGGSPAGTAGSVPILSTRVIVGTGLTLTTPTIPNGTGSGSGNSSPSGLGGSVLGGAGAQTRPGTSARTTGLGTAGASRAMGSPGLRPLVALPTSTPILRPGAQLSQTGVGSLGLGQVGRSLAAAPFNLAAPVRTSPRLGSSGVPFGRTAAGGIARSGGMRAGGAGGGR